MKQMNIALLCLTVYEHITTLDDEIRYFWNCPWSLSRGLFLSNRYMLPFLTSLIVLVDSVTLPEKSFCEVALRLPFILDVVALGIIQAMLVVRVWYLFSNNRTAQISVLLAFLVTFIFSMYLMISAVASFVVLENITNPPEFSRGCKVSRPMAFGRVYLPSVFLHAVLYAMTAYRALKNRRLLKQAPILKRLVRDGGFFMLVIFLVVPFITIGSFLYHTPMINFPAIFSPILLTLSSIAISRVMFSIQSLASKLGSNSAWLLNDHELNRLGWKQGSYEGELVVECTTVVGDSDDDMEKGSFPHGPTPPPMVRVTRVGQLEETQWVQGYLKV